MRASVVPPPVAAVCPVVSGCVQVCPVVSDRVRSCPIVSGRVRSPVMSGQKLEAFAHVILSG